MQKLQQRTAYLTKYAARRQARGQKIREVDERWSAARETQVRSRFLAEYIKDERQRRRLRYETGNLAPRYDVGDGVERYATIEPSVINGAQRPWNVYSKEVWPFEKGDRVVITAGRDKGNIGKLTDVDLKHGTGKIAGLNMADYFIPESIRKEDGLSGDPIIAIPLAIPLQNLKLVHPIRDPTTGGFVDTIIENIQCKNRGWNKTTRKHVKGERFIPAPKGFPKLGAQIPWPAEEEPAPKDEHDDDTLRLDVDEVTATPFLHHAPMPPSVIDELRNKYSKYRTRHEDWYIAKKEAEDHDSEQQKRLARMVSTPTMELKEKIRAEREAAEKELSEEQLAKIGHVMAVERMKAVAEAAARSKK